MDLDGFGLGSGYLYTVAVYRSFHKTLYFSTIILHGSILTSGGIHLTVLQCTDSKILTTSCKNQSSRPTAMQTSPLAQEVF
jgi:hypothetical protein